MKSTIFSTSKFYLWAALVILPLHATLIAYGDVIQSSGWTALLLKHSAEAATLMSNGNKLMYIGYGLFAAEILLLLSAVARLPKRQSATAI